MSELTLETAKAVMEVATRYEAWDGPIADETMIADATAVINSVVQATKNGSVAVAVLEVAKAAELPPSEMSEQTLAAYTQRFGNGAAENGNPPVESAAPAPTSAFSDPAPTPVASEGTPSDAAPASPSDDVSDIFPGYDDFKVVDIKKAILDSAASGDLSEAEWERIKAYEAAHEERKTLLSLEPQFKQPEPTPEPVQAEIHAPAAQPFVSQPTSAEIHAAMGSDVVSDFYEGNTPSRAAQEGLPMPQPVDFSQHPPVLPIDITTVSDQELSRIATMFHSSFAYALLLQSQEEGRERAAEHLEREHERDAYVRAYELHKQAIPEEKRTQPTALEAARKAAEHDAENTDKVRFYRSRKVLHGINTRELKALAAGFDKAVWRVNEELDRRARLSTNSHAVR